MSLRWILLLVGVGALLLQTRAQALEFIPFDCPRKVAVVADNIKSEQLLAEIEPL